MPLRRVQVVTCVVEAKMLVAWVEWPVPTLPAGEQAKTRRTQVATASAARAEEAVLTRAGGELPRRCREEAAVL